MPANPEDNQIDRFERAGLQRFSARQSVAVVLVAAIVLLLATGSSIKKQAEELHPGIGRSALLAVGDPADSLARALPVQAAAHRLTGFIHPDPQLGSAGAFTTAGVSGSAGGVPPVTPESFTPGALGTASPARRPLHTLLVTGDSMSQTPAAALADDLSPRGVHVIQDPHFGTGISSTLIVNWGSLATYQVRTHHPQAVVMFIGANDGYSMPGPHGSTLNCCGVAWATEYAERVRQVMNTFRAGGATRVYWLLLPAFRGAARQEVAHVIDAAFEVAAQPYASQVQIVDTVPTLTPGDRYTDSLAIGGTPTIVRQSDGIHLNAAGAELAAHLVLGELRTAFSY